MQNVANQALMRVAVTTVVPAEESRLLSGIAQQAPESCGLPSMEESAAATVCIHTPDIFWSVMAALFSAGHPAGELPAALVIWAETAHPSAFTHLTKSLDSPPAIRRTLAAIYRRMDVAEDPFDQACLEEATRNDPESAGFLRPYIARDEQGMTEIDGWDASWRGVRDETDRLVVEAWHAAMKERP